VSAKLDLATVAASKADLAKRRAQARRIWAALVVAQGSVRGAAVALEVPERTLTRRIAADAARGGDIRRRLAERFKSRKGRRLDADGNPVVSRRKKGTVKKTKDKACAM
jgi:hypothetical protein